MMTRFRQMDDADDACITLRDEFNELMHTRGLPFDSKMIEYAINNLVVHPNLVFNGKANNFAWVRLG
jgi:hypothetical protein